VSGLQAKAPPTYSRPITTTSSSSGSSSSSSSGSRPNLPVPKAAITAVPAPDDGCQHTKHVELPTEM